MPDTHPAPGPRPASAPAYEPVMRLGTPPQPAPGPAGGTASRLTHPVLLPDSTDLDDEIVAPAQQPALTAAALAATATMTAPAARPVPKAHWYAYVASGIAGAVLVIATYGLLTSRGGLSGNRAGADAAAAGAAVTDTALLDRRADTLALAIAAFGMRANMYETRRMPCTGLARGLAQVEDAWLGYNMARKNLLATSDPARDARDKSLYADVRGVEVRFERSACTRP